MSENADKDDLLRRAKEAGLRAGSPVPVSQQDDSGGAMRARWVSVKPIIAVVALPVRWFMRWLRWAAYAPVEGESGRRTFSTKRLAICMLATVAAVFIAHAAMRAGYYYSTKFEETVYVTGKQEIETGELYQFGGCTSLPCSTATDNGKFYLIESSLYFPRMFYPEENVFANIPQQDAACHVIGYGIYFRSLRWLYKSAQLYQHVTDVSCRPYTADEIRQAVEHGTIIDAE